jgi:murein DD-endopeptidase MepM/ murein hydrolase activator NlpD
LRGQCSSRGHAEPSAPALENQDQQLNALDLFERRALDVATRAMDFAGRHPRGLAAAVTAALAGFAATAFGIAPAIDEPPSLTQRVISEAVQPADLAVQAELLAEQELSLYRSDLMRRSDTADSLLRRLGAEDADFTAFLRRDPVARKLLDGRPGKMVQLRTGEGGRVEELVARYPAETSQQTSSHFTRLTVERAAGTLRASTETVPLESQVRLGSGTINSSLFAATDDARLPDAVASQMVEMFSTEIDFHRELRKGDTFTVIYEALTADGEPITWGSGTEMTGRVLAAEFVNRGRSYSSVWYAESGGKGTYYGLDGQTKRRAFLGSPLAFSRVTSTFAMRMHPILNTWRAHLGVDYGAPKGTPVRSVGEGVVELAGWQNGYGNVVQIKHAGERMTVYAHLSRIDVRKGQRVEQGAQVGAVGATGWATGPHLHFEFKVNGRQQNPLAMAKASEALSIAQPDRQKFAMHVTQVRTQLEVAASMAGRTSFSE